MLTVLRVIDQNLSSPNAKSTPSQLMASIRRDNFKIIYVYATTFIYERSVGTIEVPDSCMCSAPMKALAAEIVRKLGKRLAWLSIRVKELTGAPPFVTLGLLDTH